MGVVDGSMPWVLHGPRCAAMPPEGPGGKPVPCPRAMEWVGLVRRRPDGDRPVQVWLCFTCTEHRDRIPLVAARPLAGRDREVLHEWWREAQRWEHPPGHPDRPTPTRPWVPPRALAEGEEAHELWTRAKAWERRG